MTKKSEWKAYEQIAEVEPARALHDRTAAWIETARSQTGREGYEAVCIHGTRAGGRLYRSRAVSEAASKMFCDDCRYEERKSQTRCVSKLKWEKVANRIHGTVDAPFYTVHRVEDARHDEQPWIAIDQRGVILGAYTNLAAAKHGCAEFDARREEEARLRSVEQLELELARARDLLKEASAFMQREGSTQDGADTFDLVDQIDHYLKEREA